LVVTFIAYWRIGLTILSTPARTKWKTKKAQVNIFLSLAKMIEFLDKFAPLILSFGLIAVLLFLVFVELLKKNKK